jgi:hypothetical protein
LSGAHERHPTLGKKDLPQNLGCHSQELSKEAPFILKPKKECIIFLQRKQASKAVNLRVRNRNRGEKKATPT